ncbi:MAG: glycosyltransferase family 4 protein [Deltaproteobacteria bacterium]|nr:glycosyltransferase family 4 protein [Deltaproteobacteria bacterium]
MRIGINGRFLAAKRTGVQRAAYNLIKALVRVDHVNEYYLFTSADQATNPDWNFPNVKVIAANIREGENFRNHLWEQFVLPRLAMRHQIDILHSPANLAPLLYRGKSIVHIHDLCFVVNPQWFSFSFRTLYNFVIPRLARRAAKVITNSNNSRNDLLQFCNLPAERVSQVYWAVDDLFTSRDREDNQPTDWNLNDYILYVGSLEPRKNIGTLLEAYELMRSRYPDLKPKLVLIGGESPLFAEVRLKVKKFKDDILFKGFVNDEMLRASYRHASIFVYPSLYEGFGLPPLEAMASGVPVVTTLTSSLPEVVGDAAMMVSPYNVEQLAETMANVLTKPELRRDMITKGKEQVRKFNWYRVARNTLAVYYEVYNAQPAAAGDSRQFLPFSVWRELRDLEARELPPATLTLS